MTKPAVAALTISAFFIAATALAHHGHHEADPDMAPDAKALAIQKIDQSYVQDVKPIFSAKCADCHSTNTVYPPYYKIPLVKQLIDHDVNEAREHLDISHDFPFIGHGGKESMTNNFNAIREEAGDGDMPPWRYTLMHPQTKLTAEDKQKISVWISQSEALLK